MQDTDITIKILDAQDGDATIVHLRKPTGDLLVLIDGGHPGDAPVVMEALSPFLTLTGKKAPDLVICTHYDSDHIGGLNAIIRHYSNDIKEVWIHNTTQVLNITEKTHLPSGRHIFPSETDDLLGTLEDFMENNNDGELTALLESIAQGRALIGLVMDMGIPTREPVAGSCQISGWQEIEVLGPTPAYYKRLFPKHFNTTTFLQNELKDDKALLETTIRKYIDPCRQLDTYKKTGVSATNLNSTIIKITAKSLTYLFTADAGIPSFENIPSYKEVLKNIDWLKVPHHGSLKNLNSAMIEMMSPTIAVISGNKRIDDSVIECLEQHGATVFTTRDNGPLTFKGLLPIL